MWVTIKCFLFVSALFLLNITDTIAQKKVKFGDISTEDISVIADNDTTASAIILYENCSVRLDIVNDDFALVTQHMVRIKVLKASGLDWANIVIPFYVTNSRENSESVYSISGYTYNEANGKIDRVKLSKEHIFEEKTSENQKRIKIAFPNVKAGSVFELKYEKSSPYYSYIDDFIFQKSIPVKYSTYKVVIPEYFRFSKRTGGYETMDYKEDKINMSMMLNGGNRLSCTGSEMTFTVSELPALKDDNFVWNKDDYRSKVIFDLVRVEIPGILFKNFSATWEDIDKQLTEDDKFGKQLKYSNLLKNELSGILNDTLSSADQVTAILNLVKGKVQWNEKNTLYIDNVKKALKEGVGTSGELNALLICLLRDAGFNAYPVVMSLRNHGRIFSMFPTLKSLNYFIVGVDIDGKPAYVDASYKYGDINLIPANCMVQEARCIHGNNSQWVDLHNIGKNGSIINIRASFDGGVFTGTVYKNLKGIPSAIYSEKIDQYKDITELKETIENDYHIKVSNFDYKTQKEASLIETYTFENDGITTGDDYIYLSSLIFPNIKENPFKAETRKLPIEYPYPYDQILNVTIFIPEGYTVDELPATEKIYMGDRQIIYSFVNQKSENQVQVTQRITLKETLFPAQEYQHIRDFWARIADKNASQIVLKRIKQ